MKIAIITNLYPPFVRGGAEQVVVRTVRALTNLGHQVVVITGRPPCIKSEMRERDAAERVYRFYPPNIYFTLRSHQFPWIIRLPWHIIDAFSPVAPKRVVKILKKEQPDVVITHNLKGIGLGIANEVQKNGFPHVHVVHDLQLIYPSGLLYAGTEPNKWYFRPSYGTYRAVCRQKFGTPELVIFPSQYLHDTYQDYGFFKETKTCVLPNPAPAFPQIPHKNTTDGRINLLFVGQIEYHKGISFLLDAMNDLPENYKLIIAGEGRLENLVKKKASKDKRIIYLGFISVDQLIKCLAVSDALVVPSLCYENSPTVIYEALQAGLPVIASNIGGVGELVHPGENGFLFNPGSKTDFMVALEKLRQKKDQGGFSEDQIRASIAPHAIEIYAQKLMEMLTEAKNQSDTRKS
jgi:glycosyltransferase involved in cell wall biosynthesis